MLGQPHRPADDDPLRVQHHPQEQLDVLTRQAGRGERRVPVGRAGGLFELSETVGVFADEVLVDRARGVQDQLVQETEQGLVAADADLEEQIGQRGAGGESLGRLRVLEALQARLGERVDAHHARAVLLGLLQGGQHARVVGARVLPGDHDEVRPVQVLQQHAALADADRLRQGRAGRLVAHVGAVGEVVGAELAREELVEERGLVAGAARGVEDGLVGDERGQLLGDDVEGAFPAHRLVVGCALREVHGVGQPALLSQPVAAAAGQVGDRVRGEELRGDPAQRGLLGDRLRAVLAELRLVPVLGLRPGAAGAVEAVLLVDAEQGQGGALHAHLLVGHAEGVTDGGEPGGCPFGLGHGRCVLDRVTLGRLRCHRALLFTHTCEVDLRSCHAGVELRPSGAGCGRMPAAQGCGAVGCAGRLRGWVVRGRGGGGRPRSGAIALLGRGRARTRRPLRAPVPTPSPPRRGRLQRRWPRVRGRTTAAGCRQPRAVA